MLFIGVIFGSRVPILAPRAAESALPSESRKIRLNLPRGACGRARTTQRSLIARPPFLRGVFEASIRTLAPLAPAPEPRRV